MEQKEEEKEKSDNKKTLQRNLLVRESLEIRRKKTSIGLGLNDPQLCVRSNAWDPILFKLKDNWYMFLVVFCLGRGPESYL